MDPMLIAASLQGIAAIAQAIEQAQAGQLTPEQLADAWQAQANRCKAANDAWTAAAQP